jgi:hypothetical protein
VKKNKLNIIQVGWVNMKILSIGNFDRPSWDGSITDENHIADALGELGHNVVRCQWREGISNTNKYDFILIAQWNGYGDSLDKLKEFGCPIVYWAFDYQADGQEWHEKLIKASDLYLSKRLSDSKYPNWRWLAQDFAPSFLDRNPTEDSYDMADVLFTGSYLDWNVERTALLQTIDEEFDLRVYSATPNGWIESGLRNVNGPVMDHLLPQIYSTAKIIVSVDLFNEAGYWSDRNAQIMACGGFTLFWHVPMSESVFKDGVAYFYSIEDCMKKIRYYLDNSQERERISTRGYELAHSNLMVKNRVKELLVIVESIL